MLPLTGAVAGRMHPGNSNFNGALVFVIALLAVMMSVGGYTIYNLQERLTRSDELLEQGQENIRQLEDRLAATGTDVSKTFQDLKAQVETNFSEIDKLWQVSHRQNRPDIQKNIRAIAALDEKIGNMDSSAKKKLDELLEKGTEELITEIALLRSQVQDQAVKQEARQRNMNSLNRQVKELQEAINSIDDYRRQLNQRLLELQNQGRKPEPSLASPGEF